MHSPGMLGARLGAFLRTPAFRALPRRSGGVVRLQGKRQEKCGEISRCKPFAAPPPANDVVPRVDASYYAGTFNMPT